MGPLVTNNDQHKAVQQREGFFLRVIFFFFCSVIIDNILSLLREAINSISLAAQFAAAILRLTSRS